MNVAIENGTYTYFLGTRINALETNNQQSGLRSVRLELENAQPVYSGQHVSPWRLSNERRNIVGGSSVVVVEVCVETGTANLYVNDQFYLTIGSGCTQVEGRVFAVESSEDSSGTYQVLQ